MSSKDKIISVRLSEPEYHALVDVAKDMGISPFVRSAIQRAILEGPDIQAREAASLRLHLVKLLRAKSKIQDLFRLWQETGKIERLLEIKVVQEEYPELRLELEIGQALKAFTGDQK